MNSLSYQVTVGRISSHNYGKLFAVPADHQHEKFTTVSVLNHVMCFSLLSIVPSVRMHHTSDKIFGQIYIPFVNWVLCFGTIIFVAAFKDLNKLTNAYG